MFAPNQLKYDVNFWNEALHRDSQAVFKPSLLHLTSANYNIIAHIY